MGCSYPPHPASQDRDPGRGLRTLMEAGILLLFIGAGPNRKPKPPRFGLGSRIYTTMRLDRERCMTKEEIKRQKLRSRSQTMQPPPTRKVAGRKHKPGPPKHPKRQRQEEEI